MTKVCVTGCSGLVGSHTVKYLLENGLQVVGIDKEPLPEYIKNIGLEFYQFDITGRVKKIEEIIKGCEVVYHCAAYAAEIMSLFKPIYISQQNIMGSLNMLVASTNTNVRTFVFTSSNSIYGEQPECPYPEDVDKQPDDIYAIGKLATEQMIKVICETHDMDYVIIRPHNIIGPQQNYKDAYRNVIAIWMNRIKRGEKPIVYGDGLQERAFTYIEDFVPFFADCPFNINCTNEIFNIGGDENITIKEAAEIVCEVTGFEKGYDYADARPNEVKISYPSQSKAKEIGYKTHNSFVEGVTKMWKWMKTQPIENFKYWDNEDIEIWNKMPKVWKEKLL